MWQFWLITSVLSRDYSLWISPLSLAVSPWLHYLEHSHQTDGQKTFSPAFCIKQTNEFALTSSVTANCAWLLNFICSNNKSCVLYNLLNFNFSCNVFSIVQFLILAIWVNADCVRIYLCSWKEWCILCRCQPIIHCMDMIGGHQCRKYCIEKYPTNHRSRNSTTAQYTSVLYRHLLPTAGLVPWVALCPITWNIDTFLYLIWICIIGKMVNLINDTWQQKM